MNPAAARRVCASCGAINLGSQTACLRCHTPLSPMAGVQCPKCGRALSAASRFCDQCGTKIQEVAPAAARSCPRCGARLAAGLKFCTQCGARL